MQLLLQIVNGHNNLDLYFLFRYNILCKRDLSPFQNQLYSNPYIAYELLVESADEYVQIDECIAIQWL